MVVSFFKGNAEKQRRLDFALFFFAFCIFFKQNCPRRESLQMHDRAAHPLRAESNL